MGSNTKRCRALSPVTAAGASELPWQQRFALWSCQPEMALAAKTQPPS